MFYRSLASTISKMRIEINSGRQMAAPFNFAKRKELELQTEKKGSKENVSMMNQMKLTKFPSKNLFFFRIKNQNAQEK